MSLKQAEPGRVQRQERYSLESSDAFTLKRYLNHFLGFAGQLGASKVEGQMLAGLKVNDVFVTKGGDEPTNAKAKVGSLRRTDLLAGDRFVTRQFVGVPVWELMAQGYCF